MARPPSVLLLGLCLSSVLGGCLDDGTHQEGGVVLTELFGCDFAYPNDIAIDCTRDAAVPIDHASIPERWVCIDRAGDEDAYANLWSDLDGHYGFDYRSPFKGPTTGVITVTTTSGNHRLLFDGPQESFVRIHGRIEGNPSYNVTFHSIETKGTPAFLESQNLELRRSWFRDDAWFIYAFPLDNGTELYDQFMVQRVFEDGTRTWEPGSIHRTGKDFDLDIIARNYSAQGEAAAGPQNAVLNCGVKVR